MSILKKIIKPKSGGHAVNSGQGPLWEFLNKEHPDGTFRSFDPQEVSYLYYPLCNNAGFKSAITPEWKGDIKLNQNSFLTPPISTEDLASTTYGRNFWICVHGDEPWSVVGQSLRQKIEHEDNELQAGPGWIMNSRIHPRLALSSRIITFVPGNQDKVEVSIITITNNSADYQTIYGTSSLPLFCRSADNQRDHREVTTLLNRAKLYPNGLVVKPNMAFDERGHTINNTSYAVFGWVSDGQAPLGVWGSMLDFIGEGGTLDWPEAVLQNRQPPAYDGYQVDGKELVGAIKFSPVTLPPKKSITYVVLYGITDQPLEIDRWKQTYSNLSQVEKILQETKSAWQKSINEIVITTADADFNNWTKWITYQPMLRKVFGCSFLPDFSYGRGGRGWRDLWQDCLALLLTEPDEVRNILINNCAGIRADGSNATIIGNKAGEFLADRNNITRIWMDHGVWPIFTTAFYIEQTGDLDILLHEQVYFKDRQCMRAKAHDERWNNEEGTLLKTTAGEIYHGTLLEHFLIQNVTMFYNVGQHNIIRLEDADWNDGLDMAGIKGESVPFTAFYAANLERLASYLEILAKRGTRTIAVMQETAILFDRTTGQHSVDYDLWQSRTKRLNAYMQKVSHTVSGDKINITIDEIVVDLKTKAEALRQTIQKEEWLSTKSGDQFFAGYYDNDGNRVEGDHDNGLRMSLTGQVFPIMAGIADKEQIAAAYASTVKYLRDPVHGGFRLNSNYYELLLNLGRAFAFQYGEKENGAVFSHMAVMLGYALYHRQFPLQGWEVIESLYKMSANSAVSKIFPGLPEYFNAEGRGRYHYLTGSASWMLLTLVTQTFGVRGQLGDLCLQPQLIPAQYNLKGIASIDLSFAGRRIKVNYHNPQKISPDHSAIISVRMNQLEIDDQIQVDGNTGLIPKTVLLAMPADKLLTLDITIGSPPPLT